MTGVLRACGVVMSLGISALSCGGAPLGAPIGATPRPAVKVEDWPPRATSAGGAATVTTVLASADGARVRVRAYLVAIAPPCPACNVGGQRGASSNETDRIGRTARPRGPSMPGCVPCPPAAVTLSDELPTASPSPASAPLRATGSAEGLQARHVGHLFLLTGTFRKHAESGPELDVTDVRALAGD